MYNACTTCMNFLQYPYYRNEGIAEVDPGPVRALHVQHRLR